MKRKTGLPQLIVCIALLAFAACKSVKVSQKTTSTQPQSQIRPCDQIIKYHSDMIKVPGGQDQNFSTDIIINPFTKLITLSSEPPNEEKVSFDTVIEHIDCNLNAGLTEGQSVYTGYIKQNDGTTTKAIVKVEAKDGNLTIFNADPERPSDFIIVISKWEVVSE